MYINKLTLNNFRNYDDQEIEFGNNINIIYGDNAQGKTNIIEAIFLCSMGRSFRSKKDSDLIKFNKNDAKIKIEYKKVDREGTTEVKINSQKTFFINGVKQNRISDIIGKVNTIIFTPSDIDIIKAGPQRRRKFLDMMISSLKPNYIYLLNNYNKIIEQRNNYLKQIRFENKPENMLDIWDEQLALYSSQIFEYRNKYVDKISKNIGDIHKMITNCGKDNEKINIKYISTGKDKESFLNNIKKSRKIDIQRGYTNIGIHKDDIIFYINERPAVLFGSQGQQRSIILSLKLSELQIVYEENNDYPILLLDDFMSELDFKRRKFFLEKIKNHQVIITCTDKIDLESENQVVYYIENGKATREI